MTTEPDPIVLQGQCIVSRALLKPGATIRQMFRQPAQIPADSGWRFLTGKEDEEYMDDPDNFATRELAKMVALDASILPFLDRPAFTCLMRDQRDEAFREYTTQKPLSQKVFTVAFLAVFILAVLYSMVAVILYLPPYSWVADLQIRIFGGHLKFLSFLVGMVIMGAAAFAIAIPAHLLVTRVAARRGQPWLVDTPQFPEAIYPDRGPLPGDSPATRRVLAFGRYAPAFVPVLVGLGFMIFGFVKWRAVPDTIEPAVVQFSELRTLPSVSYVQLAASARWSQALRADSGPGITDTYVPLDAPRVVAGGFCKVVMKVSKYDLDEARAAQSFTGMLSRNAVKGEIASGFAKQGVELNRRHFLLEYDITPKQAAGSALFGVILGGVMLIAGLIMAGVLWRRGRRETAAMLHP